jgi:hypothetical protein
VVAFQNDLRTRLSRAPQRVGPQLWHQSGEPSYCESQGSRSKAAARSLAGAAVITGVRMSAFVSLPGVGLRREARVTQRAGAMEERERVRATCTAPAGANLSIPKLSRRFRPLQGATAQSLLRCELKLRLASTIFGRRHVRSRRVADRRYRRARRLTRWFCLPAEDAADAASRLRFQTALRSGHRTSAIAVEGNPIAHKDLLLAASANACYPASAEPRR